MRNDKRDALLELRRTTRRLVVNALKLGAGSTEILTNVGVGIDEAAREMDVKVERNAA
jgi:hypothetical protein